ncbi:MAG: hypothetical protein AAF673_02120 [Pseudomonadota bacterium]
MKKRKPVCLICSEDGFDMCVIHNLKKMYSKLGFSVIISKKPSECNLLVVARGSDLHIDESFSRKIPIHIYNYVGNDISNIINKVSNNPYHVLAPSLDLLKYNHVEGNRGTILFPPVYPEDWVNEKAINMKYIKYDLVHIGNKKIADGACEDKYTKALDNLVNQGIVYVWGRGWQKKDLGNKYCGSTSVFNVKNIYSRTKFALGLMYPFQRKLGTFSGRFWQAPLNGAILLSEPNRYIGIIPGIIESDLVNIETIISKKFSRKEISQTSITYWNKKTLETEYKVKELLDISPPSHDRIDNIFIKEIIDKSLHKLRVKKANYKHYLSNLIG